MSKSEKTDEEKLFEFWSSRNSKTDFAEVVASAKKGYFSDVHGKEHLREIGGQLARYILNGFPLTKAEYHLALALGYLTGEVSYITFFKKHWHETEDHRSYGSAASCSTCEDHARIAKVLEKK